MVLGHDEDPDGPRRLLDEVDAARLGGALSADASVRRVLDELWPPLTARQVVTDLFGDTNGHWSAEDVPLLDEAAALVGEGTGVTFGHVVVDEAQELSAMAWRMVMRRCPSRSMTVVGDLAQTSDPAGVSSWDHALRPHVDDRWRLAQLTVNYRTPAEIMDATADLFAAHHLGLLPPRSARTAGESPWRRRHHARGTAPCRRRHRHQAHRRPVGDHHPAPHLASLEAALHLATPSAITDPVVVLTPVQAKGLEFDSVLIVDPATILAAPLGHNDLYVAMTRATRRLGIVHPGPVPHELARIRVGSSA